MAGEDHASGGVFGGRSLVGGCAPMQTLEVEVCLFVLPAVVEPELVSHVSR